MDAYHLRYQPARRAGGFGFCIDLPDDFIPRAHALGIPWDGLAEQARHTLEQLDLEAPPDLLGHDRGLLVHIRLPGPLAPGMSLDRYPDPVYVPHNIDSPAQTCALLAITTDYLRLVYARLEDVQPD